MTTNPFMDNYEVTSEQDLLNDLIVESIQNHGQDMKYIPRQLVNYDQLFGTDDSSRFDATYTVEMLIKSTMGFGGDKEFYSQFGHQIRDEVVFSVAKDRWIAEIGIYEEQPTPNEGDLIYFPMNKKCFVIKYVDPREMFYQLGKIYTWELTCEVFEYSGEEIDTSFEEVDQITEISTNIIVWAFMTEDGFVLTDEDGNILTVDEFNLEDVNPDSVNDYIPPELEDTTELDITEEDPFDFIKGQAF